MWWMPHASVNTLLSLHRMPLGISTPRRNKLYSVIWTSKEVPRWSFILWLLVQQRLEYEGYTCWLGFGCSGNMSYAMGIMRIITICFFCCPYSLSVWKQSTDKNLPRNVPSGLDDVVARNVPSGLLLLYTAYGAKGIKGCSKTKQAL